MKKKRPSGVKRALGPREKRRLCQLLVCLALFAAVFFGRGLLPGGLDRLRTVLTANTDFKAVFAQLGEDLQQGIQVARAWWSPQPVEPPVPTSAPEPTLEPTTPEPTPTPTPIPEPTSYPYDGPAAPANATMAYDSLNLAQTMTPVEGGYTDVYGWRTHPITGESNFHHGLDIAAAQGTDVCAFADGVVDFVGEGDSYGKYIQLRHSDSVTTLYAHCSELLLPKGAQVKMGDVIAKVGSTGMATGPHLHFEVKVDGVWHDPAYYLAEPQ